MSSSLSKRLIDRYKEKTAPIVWGGPDRRSAGEADLDTGGEFIVTVGHSLATDPVVNHDTDIVLGAEVFGIPDGEYAGADLRQGGESRRPIEGRAQQLEPLADVHHPIFRRPHEPAEEAGATTFGRPALVDEVVEDGRKVATLQVISDHIERDQAPGDHVFEAGRVVQFASHLVEGETKRILLSFAENDLAAHSRPPTL